MSQCDDDNMTEATVIYGFCGLFEVAMKGNNLTFETAKRTVCKSGLYLGRLIVENI